MQFSGRLVIIVALAVTVMLVSNIIAVKPITLFELPFEILGSNLYVVSAAIIVFPVSYIISDVLTEVYLLMVILIYLGGLIPAAVFWGEEAEAAYGTILGATKWLLLGGFIAYIVGEFTNAVVMVVLKNLTKGRYLWTRTISSTIVGQGIDSVLFFGIAFGVSGLWPWPAAIGAMLFGWIAKSVYEIIATPLTYVVINWLKRTEQMDIYDAPRSLNPFGIFGAGEEGTSVNAALGAAD